MLPLILCRAVQTGAAVLFAGAAALRLLAWQTGAAGAMRCNRQAWVSWAALLVSGAAQLWLTAAAMSGLPLAQAGSPEAMGSIVYGTSFGAVWLVRAGLLAAVFFVRMSITASGEDACRKTTATVDALLAAGILATLVWSGHAQASRQHAWLLPAAVIHAVAAGVWPGGLLSVALLLVRARKDPRLIGDAVTVTRRFSRVSVIAVGVVASTGLLNGWGMVRTLSALWSSDYGKLLLGKAALFASMVAFGAANRRLIWQGATLPQLRRNVVWECALAGIVIAVTETLAMNAPPT